jgi:hypothetical protein
MNMRYFRALLLSILFCAPALAANMNAPLNEKPTLASEIKRGFYAESGCFTLDPKQQGFCLNDLAMADVQSHSDSRAFELGVYFAGWNSAMVAVETNSPGDWRKEAADLGGHLKRLQQELDVTDDQLIGAIPDFNDFGRQRIKVWMRTPEAEAPGTR